MRTQEIVIKQAVEALNNLGYPYLAQLLPLAIDDLLDAGQGAEPARDRISAIANVIRESEVEHSQELSREEPLNGRVQTTVEWPPPPENVPCPVCGDPTPRGDDCPACALRAQAGLIPEVPSASICVGADAPPEPVEPPAKAKEPAKAPAKRKRGRTSAKDRCPIAAFIDARPLPPQMEPVMFYSLVIDRSRGKSVDELAKAYEIPAKVRGVLLQSADRYIKFFNDLSLKEDKQLFLRLLRAKCGVASNGGGQEQVTNSGVDHMLSPETLEALRERKAAGK